MSRPKKNAARQAGGLLPADDSRREERATTVGINDFDQFLSKKSGAIDLTTRSWRHRIRTNDYVLVFVEEIDEYRWGVVEDGAALERRAGASPEEADAIARKWAPPETCRLVTFYRRDAPSHCGPVPLTMILCLVTPELFALARRAEWPLARRSIARRLTRALHTRPMAKAP